MQRFLQIVLAVLRTIGVSILWVLDQAAPIIGHSLLWLLDRTGEALWASVGRLWRQARRIAFGNWRRTSVTLLVAALAAGRYWPQQVMPILTPLMVLALTLFAYRLMFHGVWPIRWPGQRRQNRHDRD
jgi:hypothetical protein